MAKDWQKTRTAISYIVIATVAALALIVVLLVTKVTTDQQTGAAGLAALFIDKDTASSFSIGRRQKSKVRDRIDIASQILEAANGIDTKKIKMMYKANLSHDQLKGYLKVLIGRNLLSYDLDTQTFRTTEKGLRFLNIYNHMYAAIKTKK